MERTCSTIKTQLSLIKHTIQYKCIALLDASIVNTSTSNGIRRFSLHNIKLTLKLQFPLPQANRVNHKF
jgi:hypothetical protein